MSSPRDKQINNENNPRDNWLYVLIFITALIVFFNVVFIAVDALGYLSSPPSQNLKPNAERAKDAAKINCSSQIRGERLILNCDKPTPDSGTNETEKAEQNQYGFLGSINNSADRRDLFAQEGMWRAANAVVFFSLGQVLVGALTTLFLVLTFKTQRNELRAANRTAEAAERAEEPCVFFTVVAKHVEPGKGADSKIKAEMILKNYGKSPAINLNYSIRLIAIDDDSRDYSAKNLGPSGSGLILGVGEEAPMNPSLPEFSGNTYVNEASSICHYMVLCSYGYDDVRGKSIRDEGPAYCEVKVWWPNSIPEDEAIEVTQINSETYARYQNENDEYFAKQ